MAPASVVAEAAAVAAGDLIVTDLDGTLWHVEHELHPKTVEAVHRILADRVPLIVATGRRRGATARGLGGMGVSPPAVVLNGALGVDLSTGRQFQCRPFEVDTATAILAAFRSVALDPCVYVAGSGAEVAVSATPSTHQAHLDSLAGALITADLDRVVATESVLMFSLIGLPHGELTAAADKIGDLAAVHLDRAFDVPGMAAITASPLGLSKWDGVEAWCRHAGFTPTRVIALGDGPNDVELLTNADLALVPEVAHPAARAVAHHTIPKPDDGGWAAVLRYL